MPKRSEGAVVERKGLMLRMPPDLHLALRHLALDRGVPLNTLLVQVVDEWWRRQTEYPGPEASSKAPKPK